MDCNTGRDTGEPLSNIKREREDETHILIGLYYLLTWLVTHYHTTAQLYALVPAGLTRMQSSFSLYRIKGTSLQSSPDRVIGCVNGTLIRTSLSHFLLYNCLRPTNNLVQFFSLPPPAPSLWARGQWAVGCEMIGVCANSPCPRGMQGRRKQLLVEGKYSSIRNRSRTSNAVDEMSR